MLRFLTRLILFIIPLSVVFILPGIVYVYGREYMPVSNIVAVQQAYPDALFAFSYSGNFFIPYKMELIERYDPTILALGTSRSMQFRKEFFTASFINAGGAVRTFDDMDYFLAHLPSGNHIHVVLLGIDQEMLYGKYSTAGEKQDMPLAKRTLLTLSLMSRRMYLDYFAHKYSLSDLIAASRSSHDVGMAAILTHDGFRQDGSYQYYSAEHDPKLQAEALKQAKAQRGELTREQVSPDEDRILNDNLEHLDRILKQAKDRGITVVGFSPPYPPDVYDAMDSIGGFSKAMLMVAPDKVQQIFSANGETYINFSDPRTVQAKPFEFVDDIHGTDAVSLKMLMKMEEGSTSLKGYVSPQALISMLGQERNGFLKLGSDSK